MLALISFNEGEVGVSMCVMDPFLHQECVHPFHIGGRVFWQAALRQQSLVKQNVRQVVEVGVGITAELLDQGVFSIHFQDGLHLRRLLTSLLEHASQLHGHAVVFDHQAGR